ncbi:cytochrome P450 [Mangrovactinospora gilvigrisea]|nr:cytochrome P450 [Mangrovactinospora gilvigrisea]
MTVSEDPDKRWKRVRTTLTLVAAGSSAAYQLLRILNRLWPWMP